MKKLKTTCKSCKTTIIGNFCSDCGEKIVNDQDFSLINILSLSINAITSFDSKFFNSILTLLFKPGRLSYDYVIGKRKQYMQPFQIFVLSNVLFFFITDFDLLRIPSRWFFETPEIIKEAQNLVSSKNINYSELMVLYDNKVTSISKSAVVVIIPFIAIVMALINLNKKDLFGKHLIFATHTFSFLLLFTTLLFLLLVLFPFKNNYLFQIPTLLALLMYLFFSIKLFYKENFILAGLKSLAGTIFILALILFYRYAVSHFSYWLLQTT